MSCEASNDCNKNASNEVFICLRATGSNNNSKKHNRLKRNMKIKPELDDIVESESEIESDTFINDYMGVSILF